MLTIQVSQLLEGDVIDVEDAIADQEGVFTGTVIGKRLSRNESGAARVQLILREVVPEGEEGRQLLYESKVDQEVSLHT